MLRGQPLVNRILSSIYPQGWGGAGEKVVSPQISFLSFSRSSTFFPLPGTPNVICIGASTVIYLRRRSQEQFDMRTLGYPFVYIYMNCFQPIDRRLIDRLTTGRSLMPILSAHGSGSCPGFILRSVAPWPLRSTRWPFFVESASEFC